MSKRVLILGGYGTFGGRLARLLVDEERLTLIVAGRSLGKAQAFCAAYPARASLVPARFDRDGDADAQIASLAPDLIVDASGPFQVYGDDPYRIVRAALARGIDYLDLADGSDFVEGIAQFDAEAHARGVVVLTGASSFPVLTAAVVRRLSPDLKVEAISAGIAPSAYVQLGLNVIRSIASYCGKPIELTRNGAKTVGYGLAESRLFTIAPPGRVPLGRRRFSLADAPDIKVLPALWPSVRDVWLGAGTVPEVMHRVLNLFARMVRLKLLPSLLPFAWLMHWASNRIRWGEHRGGMFVAIDGTDAQGARVARSWHMIAEGDDGPYIPSMACEALIRRWLDGNRPAAGARAATNDVELTEYEALFARRAIVTGTREESAATRALPLYRRILGAAYDALPPPLREMHQLTNTLSAEGTARVTRGDGVLARLMAAVIGFPRAGENVPVRVDFKLENGRERWTRTFAGQSFHSTQEQGRGRNEWLICERFGPVSVGLAVPVEDGRLGLIVRRWSVFGVPMPLWLAPRSDAYEYAEDGKFHFHVAIAHPWTGLIVRYQGWLVPRR